MKISVLTPTAGRPIAFALAERYMRRQTRQPDEWIVADGGATPTPCTMGQVHVHDPQPAGAKNFANNLLNGLARATSDLLIICEDDDWMASEHLEAMAAVAERFPIVGAEQTQRYYNVAQRCWRTFNNVGASLCQTGIRREFWPTFEAIVREQMRAGRYGIDTTLWRAVPRANWGMVGRTTVVGIKGVPGTLGLGVGHRPAGPTWIADPDLTKLREMIGDDADTYAPFRQEVVA